MSRKYGRYVPGMFDTPSLRYTNTARKRPDKEQFLQFCRKLRLDPPTVLCKIAYWAANHFAKTHAYEVLENMIGFFRAALSVCPPGSALRQPIMAGLGRSLCSMYAQSDDKADLTQGTMLQCEAFKLTELGSVELPRKIDGIGQHFLNRYDETGKMDYMDVSLDLRRSLLAECVTRDDVRIVALVSLANGLSQRYRRLGDLADLNESITTLREASAFCKTGHQERPEVLRSLAVNLSLRALQCGSVADLDAAIQLLREALREPYSRDTHRALSALALSNALDNRFDRLGSMEDMDESISLLRVTIQICTSMKTSRAEAVHNLANRFHKRYYQLGSIDDLQEAIRQHREANTLFSPKDFQYTHSLNNLATVLAARFRRTGDPNDLEESVDLLRKAVKLRKPGDPLRAGVLNDLASVLYTRSEMNNNPIDIGEAVELFRESLSLRPVGHPHRSDSLNNLAEILVHSLNKSHSASDFDEAVSLSRQALALRGEGHPDRSNSLNGLGVILRQRYIRSNALKDVEEATHLFRQSLELRPEGHPLRFHTLNNLGDTLLARSRHLGKKDDAKEALELRKAALELTSPGHADRARALFELTGLHMDELSPHYDVSEALRYLLEAIQDSQADARYRLAYATQIIDKLTARKIPESHMVSFRPQLLAVLIATVTLLPEAASFTLDIHLRLVILSRAENVAVEAASHALILAQPHTALEVLEAGRALFWTRSLSLRPNTDGIPPALRAELQELTRQIENDSWQINLGEAQGERPTKESTEHELARRRRQSAALDSLIDRIRVVPGQERFLLPDTCEMLVRAAERGPIVILVASKVACDGLIITPAGRASRVQLPGVTQEWLRLLGEQLRDSNINSRDVALGGRAMSKVDLNKAGAKAVLGILWTRVVMPIFHALNLKKALAGSTRPRLWWCPTGQFAFLPIHAAGIYSENGECCSDYVISSYTPTLSALLHARKSLPAALRAQTKILLSAVPRPIRGSSLPATVEEILRVKQTVPESALLPLPAADDCCTDPSAGATVQTMLDKLPDASILHLASHGWQHPKDPLESGFIMRDGVLTIAKLMPLPLPNAFLAFLSACETAKGSETQPDQTVHLAATMLFAGFKSVVATMWSMSDIDGPEVAAIVYEHLFEKSEGQLDPDIVPRALDAAVCKLREKGVHPSRWAPYIHIGV